MMNNIKWRGQGNSAQSSAEQPSPFARPAAGREAAGVAAEGRAREENAGQGAAGRYRGETAGGQRRMQAAGSRRNPSADERRQERAAGRASDGNRRRAASAASAAAKTTPPEDLPATMFDHVLTVIGGTLGVVILIMVIYIGISVNGFLRPSTSAASVGTAAQTTTAAAAETEAATEDTAEETETSEDMTEVPNLLGMTITEAREALESAGLVYRFTNSYESSDIYEAGLVCKQQYEPGTLVKKNTTVKISISMGTDKVVLKGEDYIGVNLTVLEYLLNGTDIDVEYIATESDEPKNTILSIEPLDATLSPGDKLTVYYSKGPSTVAVSSLIGLTQDQAASRLSDQGLTLGNVTQEYNSSVEANLVCAQSISEGTVVKIGSSVDITISLGPKMIQIPSVIGMSEADATTTLQNSELSVTSAYENSSSAAGTVIRQSPEAGGWANQWSTVTIVVSTGPAQVTVPSVTGMTQDQAASTLASAGLSVTWTEANNDSVEAGIVTYQSVDAGTTVDAGTVISCEVSLGPAATTTTGATTAAQTTVPSVTGTQQADAEAALTAAGLTVTEWRMVSYDDVPAGTVTYQSLEAGTTVAVGSTLYCEVSSGPASQ
ncbi:MAG: PASTA domain-containing protein [Lachnospiraceae bacterium]